ncbi:MAG TPA: hypothetical protein PLZ36_14945 [Armatimonadota bacterium]|nr:hypothetical protein [Armatimonadota bacterium]
MTIPKLLVLLLASLLLAPAVAQQDAFDLLRAAAAKITALDTQEKLGWWDKLTAEERAALFATLQPAVELMEQARQAPYTPRPITVTQQEMSWLRDFRQVYRLRLLQVRVLRDQGKADDALAACLTGMEEAARLHPGGDMLTVLVSFAGHAMMQAQARELLGANLSPTACRDAIGRLVAIQAAMPTLPAILDQELTIQRPVLREIAKHPERVAGSEFSELFSSLNTKNKQRFRQEVSAGIAEYERLVRAWTGAVKKPYPDWGTPPEPKTKIAGMMFPYHVSFARHYQRMLTDQQMLLTALALQAFHTDTGVYPDTLAALCPAYLAAPPRDPFSRGVLRYARAGDTFLLYSIGPDAHDDGGAVRLDWSKNRADAKGDLVLP